MTHAQALLVIDVQRVYMEPEPMVTSNGDDLIEKCKGLIAQARESRIPVLYVQHVSENQPSDPALTAIHPELGRVNTEPIIQKHFGSAFFQTDLEAMLKRLRVQTLTICGLATFGCVNATVMCALCKAYDVRVVRDAHGSVSSGDTSAASMIEIFNDVWEKAGATLVRAESVAFRHGE